MIIQRILIEVKQKNNMKDWSFITHHGLVLMYISRTPQCTTSEIAKVVNVTERTVHRALVDLEKGGYITRTRTGRGNIYEICHNVSLRSNLTRNSVVRDLIGLIGN